MPICRHVYEVLHMGVPLKQVVETMLRAKSRRRTEGRGL